MKFSVYTIDIRDALKSVVKCADVKNNTPILSTVKITAEDGKLTLAATDYNVAALVVVPANVEASGSVCVKAKYLFDVIGKMPEDVTTFTADENSCEITSGGALFTVLVFNPQEYPRINFPIDDGFKIQASLLKEIIRKTLFAVSNDNSRPIFNGVNLVTKFKPDSGTLLQAFATNTSRIAAFLGGHVSGEANDFNVIVPAKALGDIAGELNSDSSVSIIRDGNWLTFKFDNLCYKTRLIEGEFPPTANVLDVQGDITAVFNTKEMKAALNAAKLVAKESEYKTVHLKFSENRIAITADNPDCGNFSTAVDAQCNGELEITFNVFFLTDFLNVADCTRTQMKLSNKLNPAEMRDVEGTDYLYVVTPVRVEYENS